MKKILAIIGLAVVTLAGAQAATLLSWNTFGNLGTETSQPSVSNDSNLTTSSLTLGVGVTAAANTNRFGGSHWFDTGDTNPTTLAESINGNDYIQFIVTPNAGASFTPISLVFSWDHSATGPDSLTLRSSADSFAADLGSVTGLAASLTTGNTISISGLTNISAPTTFRLYGFGATNIAGTGGFDTNVNAVNVQLNGSAVPEPKTWVLIGIGSAFMMWNLRRRREFKLPGIGDMNDERFARGGWARALPCAYHAGCSGASLTAEGVGRARSPKLRVSTRSSVRDAG